MQTYRRSSFTLKSTNQKAGKEGPFLGLEGLFFNQSEGWKFEWTNQKEVGHLGASL